MVFMGAMAVESKLVHLPFTLDNLALHSHGSHEDHEGDEGHEVWQQSHDKGCSYQDTCRAARNEDKSVLCASRELGDTCHDRGEEDRHFHNPRTLQDQDSRQTCHQGRSKDGIWSGDEMQGKASTDHREGFPSRCAQGPNLSSGSVRLHILSFPEIYFPWESHGTGLVASVVMLAVYTCHQ